MARLVTTIIRVGVLEPAWHNNTNALGPHNGNVAVGSVGGGMDARRPSSYSPENLFSLAAHWRTAHAGRRQRLPRMDVTRHRKMNDDGFAACCSAERASEAAPRLSHSLSLSKKWLLPELERAVCSRDR